MFVKSDFLKDIKLFVLDLDGTFYLGDRLLPGSLPFLEVLRETGRDYLFFTNNTSKSPDLYLTKFAGLGVPITRTRLLTAGDVTVRYLERTYPGALVYLMGNEALRADFAARGVRLLPDGAKAEAQPDIVVAAFDTELTYAKLERACAYIRRGAVFLATHPDINCPTEDGFIPDCGAFCAAIEKSTGKTPEYLGKPYTEALDLILEHTGLAKGEIAFVGDRLYTDVAAGEENGAAGILVLSGETAEEDLAASEIKPSAVFADLGALAQRLKIL